MGWTRALTLLTCALQVGAASSVFAGQPAEPVRLVSGLGLGSGSTIGPGGALYVAAPLTGQILRVDPQSGDTTVVASGLPTALPHVGVGGAMDVAFIGSTPYALVSLVADDVGGNDAVGIYRMDSPDEWTVVANIGDFARANPPQGFPFFVLTGVQYAMEPFRGGFLVTDGHHNRLLHVTLDGVISEFLTLPNIVPTGLAVAGNTVYLAEAGPVPHLPADGTVVVVNAKTRAVTTVAAGAPLLVDVEFGRGRSLFALAQGIFGGGDPGAPASPNTGSLVRVEDDGTMTPLIEGIDRPTSLEFIGTTAFVVTLTGEVWRFDGLAEPPYGWAKGN